MAVKLRIIGCPKWGAVPPKAPPIVVAKSNEIIFHHTAGHHAEISRPGDESVAESMRYARDIQAFHMKGNGWNDSGHNFLVCRNGVILQGRWLTIHTIQMKHMVESAHCPGKNDQIGIEHEHISGEKMTAPQRKSSARLMAWIADQYGRSRVLTVSPHSRYYATECPSNLKDEITVIRKMAQTILNSEGGG